MIITSKPMGRRTLLRGAGTMMALPLLEAMVPRRPGGRGGSQPPRSGCR